jgi:hypothetical protein
MYDKQVNVMEGPWEAKTFPNGEETTNVLSRKTITTLIKDGYLCEETTTREYRDGDYFDTSSSKRILKING